MKRKRKIIIFFITLTLIIITALLFPTWTPKINGENSIAILESIEINGTELEVMVRGVDRNNPIIIFCTWWTGVL